MAPTQTTAVPLSDTERATVLAFLRWLYSLAGEIGSESHGDYAICRFQTGDRGGLEWDREYDSPEEWLASYEHALSTTPPPLSLSPHRLLLEQTGEPT